MAVMILDEAFRKRLITAAAETILAHAEELTEFDRAIGDGDHGLNMKRGFEAVLSDADNLAGKPLGELLKGAGTHLVMTIGGASGPLYGSLLIAMGKAAALEDASVAAILEAGVAAVKKRGKSDRGEKTMLDVLVPVQAAWAQSCQEGLTVRPALARVRQAAREGFESTRPLMATKGRASFLRERSIGHLDPGACSSCLLVDAVCAVFLEDEP
jgi:phosphoenolpyruvate---glycerone phosphotransferase subunit DhaL